MGEGLIVRRGGSGGKSEGLYAWKKQIYQESTISFANKIQDGGNNYFTVYVTTSNPDVKPTSNDLVDMTFRLTYSGSYYLITIKSSGNATLYISDTGKTNYGSWTYDESTMLLECTFNGYGFSAGTSIKKQSSKTISRLGLVSYVISDNQSDYPSGGMYTDGYYYTLLDIPTIEQAAYNQALLDMAEVTQ